MAAFDLIVGFNSISIDPGPYYAGDLLEGTINIQFQNEEPLDLYSKVRFKVQLWTDTNVFIAEKEMVYPDFLVTGCPDPEEDCDPIKEAVYDWDFDQTPISGLPADFYIKIVKTTTTAVFDQTALFTVNNLPSSRKSILSFVFRAVDNPELNVDVYAIWNRSLSQWEAVVPNGTDVTALNPYITISPYATIAPLSLADNDFSSPPTVYRITAEDLTWNDTDIVVSFAAPANLFIYDNDVTRIIPTEAEQGDTVNYYVFISNSGLTISQGNEILTVTLHDSLNDYIFDVAQIVIESINPFVDVLKTGSFVIPTDKNYTLDGDQNNSLTITVNETIDTTMVGQEGTITIDGNDHNYVSYTGSIFTLAAVTGQSYLDGDAVLVNSGVPLGSDIDYMFSFHLNNSLVDRHLIISAWNVSSRTIVWNKLINAFIGESSITPKVYALINKDFFTLHPDDDQFWYHSDNILDGNIMYYNQEFEPYIEFFINKFEFEKVFDNIVLHSGSIGIKQIEYWTESQNQIHIWPETFPDPPTRPWIDPEFREDKWYFPVHLQEVDLNLDNADVQRMRGTWMKVRITFKPLYEAFMKSILTSFRISKT